VKKLAKSKKRRDKRGLRAAAVRALAVDVDGTLTDGGIYYSEAGEVLKRFDTRDAFGMNQLRQCGLRLAIITAEDSPIVLARARKLRIEDVYVGVTDKLEVMGRLLEKWGLAWNEIAFVGDDLNDLPVLERAGFAACPADAAPEVVRQVHYVCHRAGGHGAVREVCHFILDARESRNRPEAEA
jgi:YrbI family 3-deoxy-D-manno-octulosonate 8-phosphate phosphatase